MVVYRFMGKEEFSRFTAGVEIVGKHYHHARTTSHGVCFLPEFPCEGDEGYVPPEYCYDFLSGIVSGDVLVKFETDQELTHSRGIYAAENGRFAMDELCIPSYSRDNFTALAYAIPGELPAVWYELK